MTVAEVLSGSAAYHVEHARAETFLDSLPPACVSLAWLDLPYFGEKTEAWDNAWADDAAFLAWVGGDICARVRRVLAPNGSLYVCASARLGSHVDMVVRERFEVLTNIRWRKPASVAERQHKEGLRAPFPASETIIFAEQRGADSLALADSQYGLKCDELRGGVFEPIRAYLDGERQRAGVTRKQCDAACGNQMSSHYFSNVQWALPTRENYARLAALFNDQGDPTGRPYLSRSDIGDEYEALRLQYEALRLQYEALRLQYEALRRPFFASKDRPYTDVWDFATVNTYPGKHPCEKPEAMMEHVLEVSSRPGDVVLDCVSGSGAFPAKAVQLGRRVLAGDADAHWADVTRRRCEMARATGKTRIRRIEEAPVAQGRLF